MANSKFSYCAAQVKEHDPDRYMLTLFCPEESHDALFALFAFNYEIAKTREIVSETQLGLIRLQWWRDAIEKIYTDGEVLEHEVLKPLAKAIEEHTLPREHFEKLIYAREFDLEDKMPGNLDGLVHYADFTTSPLNSLAAKILGDNDSEPIPAISINYALSGILRAVPAFAKQRRCLLPEDLMKKHGQSMNQLYEFKRADTLPEIIKEISEIIVPGVKTENIFLQKSQKLALIYKKQLRNAGYDPFHGRILMPPLFKNIRMLLP